MKVSHIPTPDPADRQTRVAELQPEVERVDDGSEEFRRKLRKIFRIAESLNHVSVVNVAGSSPVSPNQVLNAIFLLPLLNT